MQLTAKERIIFALDVETIADADRYISLLKDEVGMFKVGNQLFTGCGKEILSILNNNNQKTFLDLKYHDIPNTVASAAAEAVKLGITMFNVHSLGGYEMMARCAESTQETAHKLGLPKPILIAVTILTSMSEKSLQEVGISTKLNPQITLLAKLAEKAGMDGVVASPQDVKLIKENCKKDFVIVTPGIRPSWSETDDHKRLSTPKIAVDNGTDFIVVGRPIRNADDPVCAAKKICAELTEEST